MHWEVDNLRDFLMSERPPPLKMQRSYPLIGKMNRAATALYRKWVISRLWIDRLQREARSWRRRINDLFVRERDKPFIVVKHNPAALGLFINDFFRLPDAVLTRYRNAGVPTGRLINELCGTDKDPRTWALAQAVEIGTYHAPSIQEQMARKDNETGKTHFIDILRLGATKPDGLPERKLASLFVKNARSSGFANLRELGLKHCQLGGCMHVTKVTKTPRRHQYKSFTSNFGPNDWALLLVA